MMKGFPRECLCACVYERAHMLGVRSKASQEQLVYWDQDLKGGQSHQDTEWEMIREEESRGEVTEALTHIWDVGFHPKSKGKLDCYFHISAWLSYVPSCWVKHQYSCC